MLKTQQFSGKTWYSCYSGDTAGAAASGAAASPAAGTAAGTNAAPASDPEVIYLLKSVFYLLKSVFHPLHFKFYTPLFKVSLDSFQHFTCLFKATPFPLSSHSGVF